jgi:hypothetical protein
VTVRAGASSFTGAMPAPAAAAGANRLDADQLAHLEDQRSFLLASIADLEREHDAGDLDDDDYTELHDDYTARAAEVLRAIGEQRTAFAEARRPRSARRTLLVVGAVALFATLAGVLVAQSIGARKPGGVASGGNTTPDPPSARAEKCIPKMQTDPPASVIGCFKKVLDDDPENVVALTWLGWDLSLTARAAGAGSEVGLLRDTSAKLLDRAVKSDPNYSYARAFRAVVAYQRGDAVAAKQYLADFRAHDPSADAQAVISQMGLEANIDALAKMPVASTTSAPVAGGG